MQEIARMGIIYLKGLLVIELLVRYTLRSWKISHYHEPHTFKWPSLCPQILYHPTVLGQPRFIILCCEMTTHFCRKYYPPNHIFYAHPQSRKAEHIHEQLNRTIVNRENASPLRLLHQTSCWTTQLFQNILTDTSFDTSFAMTWTKVSELEHTRNAAYFKVCTHSQPFKEHIWYHRHHFLLLSYEWWESPIHTQALVAQMLRHSIPHQIHVHCSYKVLC